MPLYLSLVFRLIKIWLKQFRISGLQHVVKCYFNQIQNFQELNLERMKMLRRFARMPAQPAMIVNTATRRAIYNTANTNVIMMPLLRPYIFPKLNTSIM